MQDLIISFVPTDLALLNGDPLGFVLSEARACAEEIDLPPGKFVMVKVSVVDAAVVEDLARGYPDPSDPAR